MSYYDRALEMKDELVANRRYLHENAEVGLTLPKTRAYVEEKHGNSWPHTGTPAWIPVPNPAQCAAAAPATFGCLLLSLVPAHRRLCTGSIFLFPPNQLPSCYVYATYTYFCHSFFTCSWPLAI